MSTLDVPPEVIADVRRRLDRTETSGTRVSVDEPEGIIVDTDDEHHDGWEPADIGSWLDGHRQPEMIPELLGHHTPDGEPPGLGLFYRSAINEVHGDSGSGKSWLSARAAQEEMAGGGVVLWVDLEATLDQTASRLLALGASADTLRHRLIYINPQNTIIGAVQVLHDLIARHEITMVVFDSLGEAFAIDGINEDRDDEVAPWTRAVLRPITDAGCLVLVVDHSTKAKDNPLYPSGSKRKRASWTGAGYLVEASPPFSKDTPGWLRLTVAKDRHGARPRGSVAANIRVEPAAGKELWMTIYAPKPKDDHDAEGDTFDAEVVAAIGAYLDRDPATSVSMNEVTNRALKAIKGGSERKRAAIAWAIRSGHLKETEGPRNARLVSWVRNVEGGTDDDLA
jgi:hypothetical protein